MQMPDHSGRKPQMLNNLSGNNIIMREMSMHQIWTDLTENSYQIITRLRIRRVRKIPKISAPHSVHVTVGPKLPAKESAFPHRDNPMRPQIRLFSPVNSFHYLDSRNLLKTNHN